MAQHGTLGSLLQGVSQQNPNVRPDGKNSEQINFVSDVVQGLTSRPALHHKGYISGAAECARFINAEIGGMQCIVGYGEQFVGVWDRAGVRQELTYVDESSQGYMGKDMQGYVYDGVLYLTNREVSVQEDTEPLAKQTQDGLAVVYSLGGLFSRTYYVWLEYADGTLVMGSYQTPDGTGNGDARRTSSGVIARALYDTLRNHPEVRSGTSFDIKDGTVLVKCDEPFTLTCADGEDNTSLRAVYEKTEAVAQLPEFAAHGMLVKITGNDAGVEDDYYMRFNSDDTDELGEGFGDPGVWEEWFDDTEVSSLNRFTMPQVIQKTDTGFEVRPGGWQPRRVGDSETNPFPDFVGHPIRDIGGFQSRLVFVAGPWVAMSRTNKPLDFFKKSALTELDEDPISVSSTQEGTTRLDWIIPFDRDLVLMSDPGAGQFIVSGGSALTPSNASMVKTTSFEMRGGAKPVETGKTILFPFQSGKYSGIKEFFTNDEVTTNGAETVTESVDRYISGLVDHMACSTNFNMGVFKTDAPTARNTVWVYKYLWQNLDKLQSAWSKWVFPGDVEHFFFDNSELWVILTTPEGDTALCALDLDIPDDPVTGYHVCLDRQLRLLNSGGVITRHPGAVFVQAEGCSQQGRLVRPKTSTDNGDGTWTHTFSERTVPEGASVISGVPFGRLVTPTMPRIKDQNGSVLSHYRLVVTEFFIDYVETGYLRAEMHCRHRSEPSVIEADWFPMDDEAMDPQGIGLRDGSLSVPWGERSDWSELTIASEDVRPTTVLEVEWRGQQYKRG